MTSLFRHPNGMLIRLTTAEEDELLKSMPASSGGAYRVIDIYHSEVVVLRGVLLLCTECPPKYCETCGQELAPRQYDHCGVCQDKRKYVLERFADGGDPLEAHRVSYKRRLDAGEVPWTERTDDGS